MILYFVVLQEKDLTNHYAETAAESEQLLNQMNLAKSIMAEVQMLSTFFVVYQRSEVIICIMLY